MTFLQSILFEAGFGFKDASGKRHRLYGQIQQVGSQPPIPPAVFDSIRAECGKYELSNSQRGVQAFLVIIGLWQVGMVFIGAAQSTKPLADAVISVFIAAVLWAAAWGYGRFVRASATVYGNELLAHARCAACGYPLVPSQTPTTTCPECGACWKSEKIGQEIPITQLDADA